MRHFSEFFMGFRQGIESFGINITVLINSILLFVVYFIGVGITFLFSRIKNKSFLEKNIDVEQKTYWVDLDLKKKPLDDYYRQF